MISNLAKLSQKLLCKTNTTTQKLQRSSSTCSRSSMRKALIKTFSRDKLTTRLMKVSSQSWSTRGITTLERTTMKSWGTFCFTLVTRCCSDRMSSCSQMSLSSHMLSSCSIISVPSLWQDSHYFSSTGSLILYTGTYRTWSWFYQIINHIAMV